ncbi:sigma-70 family RNA polymerase sigma factor [Paludisphaera borealis]|uniref:ECF RNA polymerase sigma factor SigE n=1 Tax=Paludisphaera borealis TaxID=1387353 RepID=A0A1U7CQL7_9BACT|nr:sigma-70 family RNA polymerase sigma factor [Paludisphaera borealis]APW61198.1 ECF RNA polymerase sigma factor SigE [Paludisphaera borealis]
MGRARVQRDVVVQQVCTLFTLGTIDGMTDGRLLERFTTFADESAEAAFSALVERHGPMVLRVCRSVLRDRHDAEDAFQATFLVMVRRARSLWVRDSLGPWLYQVAHRTATRARTVETQRRRRERKAAFGLVAEVEERPPDDLDEALHEEVARLPERYRAAVVLCLLEGLPHEQAARRLGWPVGTVQSRLARGRERLKRSLTRRGLAPSVAIAAASALPPKLAEATLQSALRYAATGSQAAAISSSILVLTEGVLRMMTLAKLKTGLLAFATVGCLGLATAVVPRSIGAHGEEPPHFQNPSAVREKAKPPEPEASVKGIPTPIDSTVLIRLEHEATVGYVRGTIIQSTPTEAIILTSSHAFPSDARRKEIESTSIKVTYRGRTRDLVGAGPSARLTATAYPLGQSDAELIDCDTARGVALVRIRPGEVLPVSPIVPPSWEPKSGTRMTTIWGDSGEFSGKFAECSVLGMTKGLQGNSIYEAIECDLAPIQGCSGVGLFTKGPDGKTNLLGGVCNFAEPGRKRGLYASPKMIYPILDKNGLSSLYQAETPNAKPSGEQAPLTAEEEPKPPAPDAPARVISYPTESTIQIQIEGEKTITASGTVISSTPKETIILTSARIFPPGAAKISVNFTAAIRMDISNWVSTIQTVGELIDSDLTRNVALVRIVPGRVLPASPIVPRNWKPKPGMNVATMRGFGGSVSGIFVQGPILGLVKGESDNAGYEAIECNLLPKQASVGSGLFTQEPLDNTYFLAGVCNFTDPQKNTGLYASPEMIYHILNKNGLSSLYQTEDPNLNSAPEPGFPLQRIGPNAGAPTSEQPSAQESAAPVSGSAGADRVRKVEQRVDAIDGKLDEIIRLLKKPH